MNCNCWEETKVIASSTLLSLSRASYDLRKLAFCFWTTWTVTETVEHGNNWYFHLCCVTRKRATRCLGKLVSFIAVTSPRNGCGVAVDAAGTKRWPHWSHRVVSLHWEQVPRPRAQAIFFTHFVPGNLHDRWPFIFYNKNTLQGFWADVFFEALNDSDPGRGGIIILQRAIVFALVKAAVDPWLPVLNWGEQRLKTQDNQKVINCAQRFVSKVEKLTAFLSRDFRTR